MAASRHVVTVTESIWIDRSPEVVFDYTQDYGRRTEWDAGVSSAKLVASDPRTARVRVRNLGAMTVRYRLDRRPERTSAAFSDVDSAWVSGGGGSWQYEPENGGTRWQQTNSLEVKRPWLGWLIGPLLEQGLRRSTRVAMAEAKRRLEAEPGR
ncbi:MAG TPA: SRPBCC family protein [Candidatus Limnocylindrales bacterium]|nr:SRPBCC family protein [Candidatus Limnocylindrales bacterium]